MSPDALSVAELQDQLDFAKGPPEGWAWATLGEILPLEYGKALPERLRDSAGKAAVYGSSGRVGWHTAAIVAGPTLIVGRKGSAGAVFYGDEDCWPIDTVYFAKPKSVIDLRYGFYFLKWKALGRLDQSTAIPSLSNAILGFSNVLLSLSNALLRLSIALLRSSNVILRLSNAIPDAKISPAGASPASLHGKPAPSGSDAATYTGLRY